jgi:hypothetical protein
VWFLLAAVVAACVTRDACMQPRRVQLAAVRTVMSEGTERTEE